MAISLCYIVGTIRRGKHYNGSDLVDLEDAGKIMAEPAKTPEKRRVPRIPAGFPVALTWGRKQHRLQSKEFSEYGILLTPAHKDMLGEDVQVALSLEPNKSSLSVSGVVAYVTEAGMGIRFKNVPQEQQAILRDYVRTRGIGIVRS